MANMATIITGKNKTTGEVREFNEQDWYAYSQTGDWEMGGSRLETSTRTTKVVVKKTGGGTGCGCGKK